MSSFASLDPFPILHPPLYFWRLTCMDSFHSFLLVASWLGMTSGQPQQKITGKEESAVRCILSASTSLRFSFSCAFTAPFMATNSLLRSQNTSHSSGLTVLTFPALLAPTYCLFMVVSLHPIHTFFCSCIMLSSNYLNRHHFLFEL